jgi:hypothetical protein
VSDLHKTNGSDLQYLLYAVGMGEIKSDSPV